MSSATVDEVVACVVADGGGASAAVAAQGLALLASAASGQQTRTALLACDGLGAAVNVLLCGISHVKVQVSRPNLVPSPG